jgi:uncharacterized protein (DUF305 family)
MKNLTAYVLLLTLLIVAVGLACQTQQPAANTVNSNAADHSGHDMSNADGHDMSKMDHGSSAPGAAEQPYDLQFIDSMIHHHEGALQMADMVLRKTERKQMRDFAQNIVNDQKKEIEQMHKRREQWYPGKPAALNMELPGMKGGTEMMNSEHMKDMDEMEPAHFDNHFFTMMTKHHEGAVEMSKDALGRLEHPDLKSLAERIIKAQEAEIKQMQQWKAEWPK